LEETRVMWGLKYQYWNWARTFVELDYVID